VTLSIYSIARVRFATSLVHWLNDEFSCVITRLDYPFTGNDSNVVAAGPLRSPPVILTNKTVSSQGWLGCNPITFPVTPPNEDINQVVIYRNNDGMLLFHINFAAIKSSNGKSIVIRQGLSRPGLCRL